MAMFWVPLEIDGVTQRVCIQFVKRGRKIYTRRCARTFWEPTPAQRAVRDNLAKAASHSYNTARENLNRNVAEAFYGWIHTSEGHNRIHNALLRAFPKDTKAIEEFMLNPVMV
jgi:hypothetical protein